MTSGLSSSSSLPPDGFKNTLLVGFPFRKEKTDFRQVVPLIPAGLEKLDGKHDLIIKRKITHSS